MKTYKTKITINKGVLSIKLNSKVKDVKNMEITVSETGDSIHLFPREPDSFIPPIYIDNNTAKNFLKGQP